MAARFPVWLTISPPGGEAYSRIKSTLRERSLHTVCEEARCPNVAECWSSGTATFMLMGDTCTRGCRFCAVKTAKNPAPLDPDEPAKVSQSVGLMGLTYVVLTSVDRDDLPDQGAGHFAAVVRRLKEDHPGLLVEVLIPDFQGDEALLAEVVRAGPDVVAHNVETVRRLTPTVRDPRATYDQSLAVLRALKRLDPTRKTKSSLMLGLGETEDEVLDALVDLRAADVDVVTFGQYLRPSSWHLPVVEFVKPGTFDEYAAIARDMGFLYAASGPLVRSSYKAGELFLSNLLARERRAAALADDTGGSPIHASEV